MERSMEFLLMLISTLTINHLVQAQEGFISLDCGLPANERSPYKEISTGLEFSSDATLIQSGKTSRIQANLVSGFLKPYTTLRYFPDGVRNCYNLNVQKGRNSLIRASFVYGNYDGLDKSPKFDLYLGPNLWDKIDLQGKDNCERREILHIPTSNPLQICLVKTGETIPMISTLEIRPVGIDSYITQSGSLKLFIRRYLRESGRDIRYPDDAYDRIWSAGFDPKWTQISTSNNVNNSNDFDPPKKALATAAIPSNASEPLTIEWSDSDSNSNQYYLYSHYAEIQHLKSNDMREFSMVWNGEVWTSEPLTPRKFRILTDFSDSPIMSEGGKCKLQLIRTPRSTFPPLLNAHEVYSVINFPHSETDEKDVVAIKSLKDAYELNRINWQGDPCVPRHLVWEGLICSYADISTPPRITSLNLSSAGLIGTIATAIQDLTQLEKLDLSNNNLTGELPEFLGNIKSLLFINLSGNDFNGSIPQALQRKGIELLVHGNPRLFHPASGTKLRKFPVAIVASTVSVVVLIGALVICLVFRKKKLLEGNLQLPPNQGNMKVSS